MSEKRPKLSQTWNAFGIANAYGEPWTPRTFDTEKHADEHMKGSSHTTKRHRVVPVRVTVRIITSVKSRAAPRKTRT